MANHFTYAGRGLLLVLGALAACGQGGGPVELSLSAPDSPQAGLPGLAALEGAPGRSTSVSGPGFLKIEPLNTFADSNATPAGSGLTLSAPAGSLASALYCVDAFDFDNLPTSLEITASGEYFVAFSHYMTSSWSYSGPFTASAETEVNYSGDLNPTHSYVSGSGRCFFAILCGGAGTAAAVTIDGLQLGVAGGGDAPRPGLLQFNRSGSPGRILGWDHSPDYLDPDFAGYVVERADGLSGPFVELAVTAARDSLYHDPTALPGEIYRFRVAALDASGNRSPWFSLTDDLALLSGVLPIFDLPHGPLFGAQVVPLDLSRSFMVDGSPLAEFAVGFENGPPNLMGPTPVFSQLLQPGCQVINGVAGSGLDAAGEIEHLVIYPEWEAEPVVVADSSNLGPYLPRLEYTRALYLAELDRILLVGYDRSIGMLAAWEYSTAGVLLHRSCAPAGAVSRIVELERTADLVFISYVSSSALLTTYDLNTHELDNETLPSLLPPGAALASNGVDQLLSVFIDDTPAGDPPGIYCFNMLAPALPTPIVTPADTVSLLDAVLRTDGQLTVAYSTALTTSVVDFDVAGGTAGPVTPIEATGPALDIQLAYDPQADATGLMFLRADRNRFAGRSGSGAWSAVQLIDDSGNAYSGGDLLCAAGVDWAFFATGAGQAQLHKRSAGVWSAVNTVSFSTDSAYHSTLLSPPELEADHEVLVWDETAQSNVHYALLRDDNTTTMRGVLERMTGQGRQLQGAVAGDTFHAVWLELSSGGIRHVSSLDNGDTWSDLGLVPAGGEPGGLDLSSDVSEGLYLSFHSDTLDQYHLKFWTGAAWPAFLARPATNTGAAALSQAPLFEGVVWGSDHTDTNYYRGGGKFGTPLVDSTYAPPFGDRIRAGVVDLYPGTGFVEERHFLLQSGTGGGKLMLFNAGNPPGSEFNQLLSIPYSGSGDDPMTYLANEDQAGRQLAASYFSYGAFGGVAPFVCLTHGPDFEPLLCEPGYPDGVAPLPRTQSLTLPGVEREKRRTVSSMVVQGNTAVLLISSLDGRCRLLWSKYGEWEDLPVPAPLLQGSHHELLCGPDGRWHVLYRNLISDDILCLSTP